MGGIKETRKEGDTASIKKDKDGYYAEIFSEELYFSEEGELHHKPQDKKK